MGYGFGGEPISQEDSVSVSVRKIDNGYIVTESKCIDGKYSCCESFSADAPKLNSPLESKQEAKPESSMANAVGLLNKRK